MIQAGKNITTKEDPLQKIKVEYLYHKLINPDQELAAKIRQLRIIRQLDTKQYSLLKRQLPYVVCGIFNPPYRHTGNFGYTEYFIVDIDHVSEKEISSVKDLKNRLISDKRIMLCFTSPGEDGLKVLFRLKERCYDAGIYSIFYKLFVLMFTRQYSLDQIIDARTSDVARACFISIDQDAYYNPEAEPVDMNTLLNDNNTSELFNIKKQLEREKNIEVLPYKSPEINGPDDEAIKLIRGLLNPTAKPLKLKQDAYVPDELNHLLESLLPYLEQSGVTLIEVVNISYGKKLKMKVGLKEAEINIFYGKKGFSVVISPRQGTNKDLNELMAQLIEQFLCN